MSIFLYISISPVVHGAAQVGCQELGLTSGEASNGAQWSPGGKCGLYVYISMICYVYMYIYIYL